MKIENHSTLRPRLYCCQIVNLDHSQNPQDGSQIRVAILARGVLHAGIGTL